MSIIIIILLIAAGLVALLFIVALFMRKDHYVRREIIIDTPVQKVFGFLRLLENQEKFNKWAKTDPNRKKIFTGTDGTVGFIYSWSGNKKAGEGAKEIMNIVEGKRIETEIRFIKPMKIKTSIIMETDELPGNQTKVTLINSGTMNYPMNIFIPIAEKNFPKDMDESLATLKNILENMHV